MSVLELQLPDHEVVVRQIHSMIEHTPDNLDRVLQEACALIEGSMKEKTPRRTGLTSASIETRKEDDLAYGVGSYSRGNILRFLDKGTGLYRTGNAIIITPKARLALHFWSKETGDEVFAAQCVVLGIIPMEIMSQSVHAHLEEIHRMMKTEGVKIE